MAREALDDAHERLARCIGADAREVIDIDENPRQRRGVGITDVADVEVLHAPHGVRGTQFGVRVMNKMMIIIIDMMIIRL